MIAELAADPQRQETVGKAAHETVERDFLWDRIAARMLAEYRKALWWPAFSTQNQKTVENAAGRTANPNIRSD